MRFFRKEGTGGTNCRFTFYREQSNKINFLLRVEQ